MSGDILGRFMVEAGLLFDHRPPLAGDWPLGVNGRRLTRFDRMRFGLMPILALVDTVEGAPAVCRALERQGWDVAYCREGQGWAKPGQQVMIAVRASGSSVHWLAKLTLTLPPPKRWRPSNEL